MAEVHLRSLSGVEGSGQVVFVYHYNADNRLVKVEGGNSNTLAEYYYDPFGRRVWKEVDGVRTYFFYSDEGLIAEYDVSGMELRSYGYKSDSTWTTDPLFLKQGSQYYFYHNDHLGTPQKLVAQNGSIVWSATYSAFGEANVDIETVKNNLRFPGQYSDAETGLHYNFHRYYDPIIGRYIKIDPIGFAGDDVNWYEYGWNSPLYWIDPYGLEIIPVYGEDWQTIENALAELKRCSPTAEALLKELSPELDGKEKFTVKILLYWGGLDAMTSGKNPNRHDFTIPGKESGVQWDPDPLTNSCRLTGLAARGCPEDQKRPPEIALAHELIHALWNLRGLPFAKESEEPAKVLEEENAAIGVCREEYENEEYTENKVIEEFNRNCPNKMPRGIPAIHPRRPYEGTKCPDPKLRNPHWEFFEPYYKKK